MVTDTVSGRGVLSVNEFLRFANIGRTKLYQEIAAGRLTVRKIGRKTVIAVSDAYTWVDSLPTVEVSRGRMVDPSGRRGDLLLASEGRGKVH